MNEPALSEPGCPECAAAEDRHHHAIYRAGCLECSARALAHSPPAWHAARSLSNEPIRPAITALANRHSKSANHIKARVWLWIGRLHNIKETS